MLDVKLGDMIVSKDKEMYLITNVEHYKDHVTYTIKSLKSRVEFVETFAYSYYRQIKGLSPSDIAHIGTIIPSEQVSATLRLLYSDTN